MGAGALIAGLCSLCTFNVLTSQEGRIFGVLPWIVGGVPTLVGAWTFLKGLGRLLGGRDVDE